MSVLWLMIWWPYFFGTHTLIHKLSNVQLWIEKKATKSNACFQYLLIISTKIWLAFLIPISTRHFDLAIYFVHQLLIVRSVLTCWKKNHSIIKNSFFLSFEYDFNRSFFTLSMCFCDQFEIRIFVQLKEVFVAIYCDYAIDGPNKWGDECWITWTPASRSEFHQN